MQSAYRHEETIDIHTLPANEGDTMSTGRSAAKRAQKRQRDLIAKQKQQSELDLAEEKDAIARRKKLASGGRSSLIVTSELGARETLG